MTRFFVIFGIALMVFAFVILTIFIIAPSVVTLDDAPFLKSLMQSVACEPNEVLTADYSTYDTPTSTTRTTDLSCVDSEQNARDVSQQLIGIGAVGYLAPFLIGLFMALLAGAQLSKTREAKQVAVLDASTQDYAQIQEQSDSLPEHLTLAQRLQELKDAYHAGLITEAEYKQKRLSLIDEN